MWPKKLPELTGEQKRIKAAFVIDWLEELPGKYRWFEKFNHITAFSKDTLPYGCKTLEVGAGIGGHIKFEDLCTQTYYALELSPEMAERIKERFPASRKVRFPRLNVIVGDIEKRLDFSDGYFNRIIAVHVLEHLPDLPSALKEIKRMLKANGSCTFVLPCEGGVMYSLARLVSAKRLFEKRYRIPYDWIARSEHPNNCGEIMEEITRAGFKIVRRRYFPFFLPFIFCNLAVSIRCEIRKANRITDIISLKLPTKNYRREIKTFAIYLLHIMTWYGNDAITLIIYFAVTSLVIGLILLILGVK